MNVKLIGDKILVEVDNEETRTETGLIVSKSIVSEQGDVKIGKVVAIGGGRVENGHWSSMTVKIGDQILFHYGTKVTMEGKSYMLVSEKDEVLVVLNP